MKPNNNNIYDANVRVCWGTPDAVYYIDDKYVEHELAYDECYGGTFGIWSGHCITSNGYDDTWGLCHDDLIAYYVFDHGWGNILSGREAYECDSYSYLNKLVKYDGEEDKIIPKTITYSWRYDEDYDDYLYNIEIIDIFKHNETYDDYTSMDLEDLFSDSVIDDILSGKGKRSQNGTKIITYENRKTYLDLLLEIGAPVLRGRFLFDYEYDDCNPLTFMSVWNEDDLTDENLRKLEKVWGTSIYDYYYVSETDKDDALKCYDEFNMPTLSDYINNKVEYNDIKSSNDKKIKKEKLFAQHLGQPKEKWEATTAWRNMGIKLNYQKLAYKDHDGNIRTDKEPMTMAQYHNLIYQEQKNHMCNNNSNKMIIITESQHKKLSYFIKNKRGSFLD